ncbi:MAG: glycosyltransferase [Xanthomarina gelatinilytica]|uniref:glycosyltransferase n=1 Tax=Xanthomarina gelatinilytica TaxID=1137281 RepID=UPI003A8A77FB
MKTICFVVPEFPTVSQTFVVNQIIAAKTQGYQVCVLTQKLGDLTQSSQQVLIEKYDLLKDTTVLDYQIPKNKIAQLLVGCRYGLRYLKFWIEPLKIHWKHRLLNLPFLIHFYSQWQHIDVFHVQFALGSTAIAEMKDIGLIKAKLITTFHGHDAHFKNRHVLKYLCNSYSTLFKVSDYVTVNTPFLKTQVIKLGCPKERLKVIPMAIDIAYFKPESINELPVGNTVKLISIGRLIEFKGFEYAIQTVKLLVDKGIDVSYTIIGEGNLFNALQKQVQSLKLQNHVTLVGKKSQEFIKQALERSHIYLMSSITDRTGRCETQGVVSAEAQAMGLPVIAFNSGGVPYTLHDGETGILVPEKDVEAFAQATLKLISHPDRYLLMSKQAREYAVANFSHGQMAKRFSKLYES